MTVPNFVKIAATTAEISQFFDFSKRRPPASLTLKISNFLTGATVKKVELHQCAKFRRNRSNRTFPANDVTHRTTPKRTVLGLNHVILSHNARTSVARFELGVGTRKKDSRIHDRNKVTNGLFYLWRSPH